MTVASKLRPPVLNLDLLKCYQLQDNDYFQCLFQIVKDWNIESQQENYEILNVENLFECLRELVNLRDKEIIQDQVVRVFNWYEKSSVSKVESNFNTTRTFINDHSTQYSTVNSIKFNKTLQSSMNLPKSFLQQSISQQLQSECQTEKIQDQDQELTEKIDDLIYQNQKKYHNDHIKGKEMAQSMKKYNKKLSQLQADASKKRCFKNCILPKMPSPPENRYKFVQNEIQADPFFSDLLEKFKYTYNENFLENQKQEKIKQQKQTEQYTMNQTLKEQNQNLAIFQNNFNKKQLDFDLNNQKKILSKFQINQIRRQNYESLNFERSIDRKKNHQKSNLVITLKQNPPINPYDFKTPQQLKLCNNIKKKLSSYDLFNENKILVKSQLLPTFKGKWKNSMVQDPKLINNPFQPLQLQK